MGIKFTASILVASDRAIAGIRPDKTGPLLKSKLSELGFDVVAIEVVSDDLKIIKKTLKKWVIEDAVNLILTTGGTGLAPSDVTPEATLEIIEKRIPGMEEHMRREAAQKVPFGILSRGVVGVVGKSLIINLPGNPDGAIENLKAVEPVIMHVLLLISGEQPHS